MRSLRWTLRSLAVLSLLLSAAPRLEATLPESPCAADAKKLCPDTPPGDGRLRICLKEHESELSATCKAQLGDARRATGVFMSVCRADVSRYCKDVPPGGGRLLTCLQAKETSLSPECREALHKRAVR
jgi:hypothetical protein